MPAALVPEGDDANNSQCEDPEKMTGSGVNSFLFLKTLKKK